MLPVTTLTLARSRLTGLGFTVAPDAQHPFGTANCCVFFKGGNYLEPITVFDRGAADVSASNRVQFVKRLRRYTQRHGAGFAMLAVQSEDAEADRAAFETAGMPGGEVFRFSRPATQPDGSVREIGVALAFAELPGAKDATLFACQHYAREALFRPELTDHPNTATGVAEVVAVADDPTLFDGALRSIMGEGDGLPLVVVSPTAFAERYGRNPPNPRGGLLLAAFDVAVLDLAMASGYAGRSAARIGERVVVPAATGLGAVMAFRSEAND